MRFALSLSALPVPVRFAADAASPRALHGSGIDELLFLLLPMVILAVVFLLAMRKAEQNAPAGESLEGAEAVEPEVPQPSDLEAGPR